MEQLKVSRPIRSHSTNSESTCIHRGCFALKMSTTVSNETGVHDVCI